MASTGAAGNNLQQYYNNPQLSDVKFVRRDTEIHLHKVILSAASGVFRQAFEGRHKDDSAHVRLKDHDEDIVIAMLKYIYGVEITPVLDCDECCLLFSLASELDIPDLISYAAQSVKGWLEGGDYDEVCYWVRIIYDDTDLHGGELRLAAEEICQQRLSELMGEELFHDTLQDIPELSVALLKRTMRVEDDE